MDCWARRKEYGQPTLEHEMEKYRYYCELPGDIWADGQFMDLVRMAQPYRGADGRVPYDQMLLEPQCYCELAIIDPSNQCANCRPAPLINCTTWAVNTIMSSDKICDSVQMQICISGREHSPRCFTLKMEAR